MVNEPAHPTNHEAVLGEIWRALEDDCSPMALAFSKTYVDASLRIGLLTEEAAELWRLRMTHECPEGAGRHMGGRAWCAYCGDVKEFSPETVP